MSRFYSFLKTCVSFFRAFFPIPISIFAIGITYILWKGGWPIETSESRINWLGISLIIAIVVLCIWFLFPKGVNNVSAKGGVVEVSINQKEESAND